MNINGHAIHKPFQQTYRVLLIYPKAKRRLMLGDGLTIEQAWQRFHSAVRRYRSACIQLREGNKQTGKLLACYNGSCLAHQDLTDDWKDAA